MALETLKLGITYEQFVQALNSNFGELQEILGDTSSVAALITAHNDSNDAHTTKFNATIQNAAYNETTGVFTFTKGDGTTITIDTKLEKVTVNFTYDTENQQLVLELDDGSSYEIPMSAFIDTYLGASTSTIIVSIDAENKISANIVNDSITMDMLATALKTTINNKVDKVTGKGLSTNDYTTAEKEKLAGIDEGANNYSHPSTHSADILVDGTTNKAFTAAEKTKLAGVQAGATKVESSATNGKVKINGTDVQVYAHPETHSADILVDGTTNKAFTAAEKTKLGGIANNANNYSHPETHSADIIVDGSTNKVFTAAEKTKLNGIASEATKVESSDTNGNIKVNGTETPVYVLPKGGSVVGGVKNGGNVTINENGNMNVGSQIAFTATDAAWSAASNGLYTATFTNTKIPLDVYRLTGTGIYQRAVVDITRTASGFSFKSAEKFAGYVQVI